MSKSGEHSEISLAIPGVTLKQSLPISMELWKDFNEIEEDIAKLNSFIANRNISVDNSDSD